MTFGHPFSFQDVLPLHLSETKLQAWLKTFWKLISQSDVHQSATYRMHPQDLSMTGKARVKNKIYETYWKFDPALGITEFRLGERRYVRKT
jgi:hypothetical protein